MVTPSVLLLKPMLTLVPCIVVSGIVLQYVAVCCSMLHYAAACSNDVNHGHAFGALTQAHSYTGTLHCSVLPYAALRCSVWQCVAVCCSVLR